MQCEKDNGVENENKKQRLRKPNTWLIGILAGENKENGVQIIIKDIMN